MQSRSRSQSLSRSPPATGRKLQNIWTMRPLGGTGGALKALAKNVAQHMNLNRSTLKRVVAQVVAEHHNLGQVDDYKGHMYYAKPERLNFLNLIAQSKEALDDLLLLDPRFAKKLQRKDQMRRFLRQHQKQAKVSSSGQKGKKAGQGLPLLKQKTPAPARGRGSSSTAPPTVAGAASRRSLNGVVLSTTHVVPPRVPKARPNALPLEKKPQKVEKASEAPPRSRSPARQQSKSAVRSRRSQRQLNTQRLPAGGSPKRGGSVQKKPLARASKVLAKNRSKARPPAKKAPPKPKVQKLPPKPKQEEKANQTNLAEKEPEQQEKQQEPPLPFHSNSRSPSPIPSKSSVTGTTIRSRKSHRELAPPAKALTKTRSKLRERERPRQRQLPIFRNYDKPWLVPRMKRRRLAGGYQVAKKESPRGPGSPGRKQPLDQIEVEWVKKDARSEQSPRAQRKARSHVGRQMRKVDFPWYTPYQFQGAAGATQRPSPRNSSPPMMARFGPNLTRSQRHHRLMQERLNRDLRREEAIDTMLNYGSGLFRRHRGEWVPAMKSSFHQLRRELSPRRSSSHHMRRELSPKRSSSQHLRKDLKPQNPSKPAIGTVQGAQLTPPPPSAVSSEAPVRPRASSMIRRRTRRQPAPVDSSLGSYADLLPPADSKEIMTRAKRRLSIAFMSKQARGSSPRRRRATPIWK